MESWKDADPWGLIAPCSSSRIDSALSHCRHPALLTRHVCRALTQLPNTANPVKGSLLVMEDPEKGSECRMGADGAAGAVLLPGSPAEPQQL